MAKKPTVTTLQSGFNSTEVLNENFENIRDAFDNTLSLDGSTPNAMEADLDLNGNNIIGATGLLVNGTDYLADVEAAKAAALVAQAAAETAETNAETAETNAESSETAAGLSATAAATSATASAASAVDATNNGAAQVSLAAAQVTLAETAKTGAELAETNAETSESNAATSATNAATSETNASTSASTASTKASEAATSATNATTSATEAETAKTGAETARDSALAALDSFDDRYLGVKTSDPTVDNDGDALVVGAIYYNSNTNLLYVYNGTTWQVTANAASGDLVSTNNLSDLTSAATARTNLGLGTNDSPTFAGIDVTGTITADGLTVDTDTLHVDTSSNRVGIGTSSPDANLEVQNTSGAASLNVRGLTDTIIRARQTGDTGFGYFSFGRSNDIFVGGLVYDHNDDNMRINSNNAERIRIDSSGNVGIGTSSPQEKLHVTGSAKLDFGSAGGNPRLYFDHDTVTDDANYIQLNRGDAGLEIISEDNLKFDTNGSEAMRIDSSGNVGIGTSSPDALLTVNGQTVIGNAVVGSSNLTNLTSGTPPQLIAGWSVPAITWTPSSSTEAVFTRDGNMQIDILAGANNFSNINFSDPDDEDVGQISYDHSTDAMRFRTSGGERLRVTASGNVGIGKTNPSTALDVTGTVTATSFEGDGSNLTGIAAGAGGGGSDEIFWENGQNVTTNYTITNGKNAMSAGPITIDSGVTVTVGAGETWTVV